MYKLTRGNISFFGKKKMANGSYIEIQERQTYLWQLSKYPKFYKNNYQLAVDAFFAEDWNKAISYLNIVINSKPDADAYFIRAYSKTRTSDFSGAINDYFNAIELRPNYVFAYNNLASVKFNNFNVIDSSIDYLKTALSQYLETIMSNTGSN